MTSAISRLMLVTGISILAISGVLIYAVIESIEEHTAKTIEAEKKSVRLLATTIEKQFDSIVKVLSTTSKLDSVISVSYSDMISDQHKGIPADADMEKRKVARAILDQYDYFDNVAFTIPNGYMYLVEPYPLQIQLSSVNFAFRDWFKGVIKTESPYLSEVFEAESTGEKTVKVAVPVKDSHGILAGIWGGIINLRFLELESSSFEMEQSGRLALFDHKGNQIIDTSGAKLSESHIDVLSEHIARSLRGSSGSTTYEFEDQKMIAFYHPIEAGSLFWGVVLVEPYDSVLHSVNTMRDQMYLAIGIVVAISLTASYLRIRAIINYHKHYTDLEDETIRLQKLLKKQDKKFKHLESKYYSRNQDNSTITKKHILVILITAVVFAGMLNTYAFYEEKIIATNLEPSKSSMNSQYVIQNLRGDTIDTWLSWRIIQGAILTVNIPELSSLSPDKQEAVRDAIMSDEVVVIDDSILHKGPEGSTSVYYKGWNGALQKVSDSNTQYYIPSHIQIIESTKGEGDIIIKFTDQTNADGFSGYTKSISDQNQILKSTITIYDINSISANQLNTLTRHEFGHALGLAHSTAPEDLMHPTIETAYPYISECDMDAIVGLYNGSQNSTVVCEK